MKILRILLDLGFEEKVDDDNFTDFVSSSPVSSFSFNNNFKNTNTTITSKSAPTISLIDNRKENQNLMILPLQLMVKSLILIVLTHLENLQ